MIILLVYVAGFVLAIWPIRQLIADPPKDVLAGGEPDGYDTGMAVLAATLWPLILLGWVAWRLSQAVWSRLLGSDREHADTPTD